MSPDQDKLIIVSILFLYLGIYYQRNNIYPIHCFASDSLSIKSPTYCLYGESVIQDIMSTSAFSIMLHLNEIICFSNFPMIKVLYYWKQISFILIFEDSCMKVLGRTDKADFPELSLTNIKIKIDTGAYTSSIHSHDIKELIVEGEKYIAFQILDPSHPMYKYEEYKTKHFKKKRIKNSFGKSEQRFIVETTIILYGDEYPIHLSLSERKDMKYPILIGRKFLNHRFSVDTSKKNISFKLKKKSTKKF